MALKKKMGKRLAAKKAKSAKRPITHKNQPGKESNSRNVVRSSEHLDFLSLAENSPNMIFINCQGRVVYANRLCEEVMGYTKSEFYSPAFDFRSLIAPEYLPVIQKLFAGHAKGQEQESVEYELVTKDKRRLDAVISTKLIDYNGNMAILGIVTDISRYKKIQQSLDLRVRLESLITGIATRFVNLPPSEVDAGIGSALGEMGVFLDEDRSYVFLFAEDGKTMDNTHEWVRPDVVSFIRNLKGLSTTSFSWTVSQIRNKMVLKIPRVADLPLEAAFDKREFESEDIKSLILIPLVCGASSIGFLGFDSVRREKDWEPDVVALLKIVGEIIASAIERRRVEDQLRYRLEFEKLIIRISSAFVGLFPEEIDNVLERSLGALGSFCSVDRIFLYQLVNGDSTFLRTHWWDASHVKPLPEKGILIDVMAMPGMMDRLTKGEVIYVGQLQDIVYSAGAHQVKEALARMHQYGVESILCVPLVVGGRMSAVLGFSSSQKWCKWSEDLVALVRVAGEIFASALEKSKVAGDLEKERQLVAALMDSVPDYIYFKDKESRFIRINKALADLFKLNDSSEAVGKTDKNFFSSEIASMFLLDEQEVIRTGKSLVGVEQKSLDKDGVVKWVSTTKMPLRDSRGNIVGTFGISRDITARKREEEENSRIQARMQHAQKLESLGILSGGIAHDFNNLLMGILGNAGLALSELVPESPAWGNIKQVEAVALRAAELTNQMLAYSGKSKFIVKSLNMTQLVKEMGHLLEVSINKHARLIYDLDDNLPLVECDPTQIRQVVMNLITNASDSIGGKSGTITLKTTAMDVDGAFLSSCYFGEDLPHGKYVCIEVADTGCGMDSETLARIFDPFFTTKITGRGLGLAAVLGIIRAHKGTLKVYSEVGKGTSFRILLRCSREQNQEPEILQKQKPAWRASGTALVIDDDEVVLTVTEQILRKTGFEVLKASNARDGLEQFARDHGKVIVVVLDVTLPEVTATEVLQKLRQIKPDVTVILMSGYSEQVVSEDVPAGMYQGFLQKPFNSDVLISKLRQLLK